MKNKLIFWFFKIFNKNRTFEHIDLAFEEDFECTTRWYIDEDGNYQLVDIKYRQ